MSGVDERFIPGSSRITEIESFHRYVLAASLCRNCRVLDAASGEGYGSLILSRCADEVVGIDYSDEAITAASRKYRRNNLRFLCANVLAVPFPDNSFDRVVSFETLEHLMEQEQFLAEIRRVLKPDGLLILSSPNRKAFRRRNHCENGENSHHVRELEADELRRQLEVLFKTVAVFQQDAFYNSVIAGSGGNQFITRTVDNDFLWQKELNQAQYSFVLATDGTLPELPTSFLLDACHDPEFGFLIDDEAVVNQFGLRGEFQNACAQLDSARKRMDELESRRSDSVRKMEHLRARLLEAEQLQERVIAKVAEISGQLRNAEAEIRNLQQQNGELRKSLNEEQKKSLFLFEESAAQKKTVEDLNRRNNELQTLLQQEHAKSVYLYEELENLKKAWSLRLFGRFALRRKMAGSRERVVGIFHRIAKSIYHALPLSLSQEVRLKDWFYRTFGRMMPQIQGYRDWQSRQGMIAALERNSHETGLEVPDDLPLTSIVIPVYNNLKLTARCLRSLYQIQSRSPFEVIVVDDASREDTASLQKSFPHIRLVRNESNLGFLKSANRGAAEATGEYLLFLNNDTEVLPHWLDELTAALYRHPEAGMIGSQMIHLSTGLLQESGNLICRDCRMLPLGRGENPDSPEFNYFREVDFCSAASCIMRKELFDRAGGFDLLYQPAYFEDPDLALKFQKAGYRNYVMPLSRIMHHEMASYGNALSEKCEANRKKFEARWSGYLAEHALYDTPEEFQQRRRYKRERVFYLDAEVPMADRGSGGMDAIFFMEYFLKRGFDVVFHGEYTPGYVPKYTTILLRMGVECVYAPQRQVWDYLRDNGGNFSWLFVSRIYQARCFDRLFKRYCPHAAYIFNTVDLHFVREHLEAELYRQPHLLQHAEETKRFELAAIRQADAAIVISSEEKKLLEQEYGITEKLWHIPQARAIAGRKHGFAGRSGAVFIGSAHHPNLDGLAYFHDEILPLLPPDFQLTIIGEALRDEIGNAEEYRHLLQCPQFRFVGFVADLGDYLNHALLTVAPLRYGAGTKGKVASSMSYGVPCVSSAFGMEGTGMIDGVNLLAAETPEQFADCIRKLSQDVELWQKISDGGLEFLQRNYAPESVEKQLDELMADAREQHARRGEDSGWRNCPVMPRLEEGSDFEAEAEGEA